MARFRKLVAQLKSDPSLAEVEPYRSIVTRDPAFSRGLATQDPTVVLEFLKGVGRAFEGTTPEEYEAEVRAFLARYRDERLGRLATELVYQPMLELFDLLRAHDWRVYVCSGGGRDFPLGVPPDEGPRLRNPRRLVGRSCESERPAWGRFASPETVIGSRAGRPRRARQCCLRRVRLAE